MMNKIQSLCLASALFSVQAVAQQNSFSTVNKTYAAALDLFDKQKYAAAAEQFRLVEEARLRTSNQTEFETKLSQIKESAQYFDALCALELGNDDAENQLLRFVKEHPENPKAKSAYFQIGSVYFKRKDYKQALTWFDQVSPAELNGRELTEYKFRKGYVYFAQEDYARARPLFNDVKRYNTPYQEDALYYAGYISYLNKDFKAALSDFEKLKNSKKYAGSYPYFISAIYYLDKRYDDVITYAVPVSQTIEDKYKANLFRIIGAAYFAKADYNNAIKYYEDFQARDQRRTQTSKDSYEMGYAYYRLKNYQKAQTELEKLVDKSDAYAQSGSYTLGDVFLKANNKQAARNAFQVASKLDFDKQIKEDALFQYAKLSNELQFHTQALDAIQQFRKLYPNSKKSDDAKTLLGEVLLNTRNYQAAVDILESIPNKNQNAREAYQKVTYYRGLEFYNERAFENAIGIFLRSLQNQEDEKVTALTRYWMAEAMFEVRKYKESVQNFERFLAMPEARTSGVYSYALYALGYSALYSEQYAKAANYLERFLSGSDKDANTVTDATLRLGDAYFSMRNYGRAQSYYNRIISQSGSGEDYALLQLGMIQGLQNQGETKINTMNNLLQRFPKSNYADDATFEIAYQHFLMNSNDQAKSELQAMIQKYPQSSYIPRAYVTIGLIDYNANRDDEALVSFKKVVQDYASTDEAKQALKQAEKIYTDKGDAKTFIDYANTTSIGNYSAAEQDQILFNAANNVYLRGDAQATLSAVNAYFEKFPNKPIHDKQARFMRAESLVKLGRYDEALPDYNYILNDWTSEYTERSLISMAKLNLRLKKYNEAVVFLKRLETNSEYKANYGFAINNLLTAYLGMEQPDDVIKYSKIIRAYEKSSQEEKFRTGLYAGKAYLAKNDTAAALKEFAYTISNTKTIAAAEAKYNVADIEYLKGQYKNSQKTCFDLINNLPNYDYWVAKTFILLADNYIAQKDVFQAKSTLKSVIDNYKASDDILPTAKKRLAEITDGGAPTEADDPSEKTSTKKQRKEEMPVEEQPKTDSVKKDTLEEQYKKQIRKPETEQPAKTDTLEEQYKRQFEQSKKDTVKTPADTTKTPH